MAEEVGVLRRRNGLAQHFRNVVVLDDLATLRGELADQLPVAPEHARDGAGFVVVEPGNLRQVADKREDDAGGRAGHGRADEQQRQPKPARPSAPAGNVGHGNSLPKK
jgi:hypothetical protein